jgi:PE-PPE domain
VPIEYPATVPFNTSYEQGVTTLTNAILSYNLPFVTVGYSQGAMVTSQVLKNGTGSGNFLGGVVMGNPMRKQGDIFPGCPDPGGHGIMSAPYLLTSTPTSWWEFAIPNDLAACIDNDLSGMILTDIFMAFCEVFSVGEVIALAEVCLKMPAWKIFPAVMAIMPYVTPDAYAEVPHAQYATYCPLNNGQTCVQLATAYVQSLQ